MIGQGPCRQARRVSPRFGRPRPGDTKRPEAPLRGALRSARASPTCRGGSPAAQNARLGPILRALPPAVEAAANKGNSALRAGFLFGYIRALYGSG